MKHRFLVHCALLGATIALTACGGTSLGPTTTPPPTPPMCVVATNRTAPFPTTFQFRNDGTTVLFLPVGCIGLDYAVSSCAAGFRDQLAPGFHCACSCDDKSCTGGVVCGPCMEPAGRPVRPGETVAVAWDGVHVTDEQRSTYSCVRSQPLPAALYRVAIRVFDSISAAAQGVGGRSVTRDFELPATGDVVDVPLALQPAEACDPTPSTSAPACTGAQDRSTPCDLDQAFTYAWEGGLSQSFDSSRVTPAASYARTRTFLDNRMAPRTCTAPIPRCSRDAREVTTGDLIRALTGDGVAAAFATPTPIIGYDSRNNDGAILIIHRADGQSLGIGDPCSGCATTFSIPPALAELKTVLGRFDWQMLRDPACGTFYP